MQDELTQLEIFDYAKEQTITFPNLLQRAKERKITTFWWAWEGLIDFKLLRKIKLRFIEGIIHEDHHFGALLFAQSKAIHILPQKLYQHRVRKGSTMTAWDIKEIPSYLKPLCAHFSYDTARQYFRIYSLTMTANGLYDFSKNSVEADLKDSFMALTMPYLLDFACGVFAYAKDPYALKPQVAELLKAFGSDSVLLSKRVRKHFKIYTSPNLWKYAVVMARFKPFYEWIKSAERKIRRCVRGVKN